MSAKKKRNWQKVRHELEHARSHSIWVSNVNGYQEFTFRLLMVSLGALGVLAADGT